MPGMFGNLQNDGLSYLSCLQSKSVPASYRPQCCCNTQKLPDGCLMLQVTCLGNCDMMKAVSGHFTSISRITGHHVDDLRNCLAEVLSPHQLHLFDNMVRRMESIAEAASKVCIPPVSHALFFTLCHN